MAKDRQQFDKLPSAMPIATSVAVEAPQAPAKDAPVEQPAAVAVEELPQFRVTLGDKSDVISAPNASEAWALFCDKHGHWPNPNKCGRTIEQVK